METAVSRNNVPIRLTDERWLHITIGHPEMANYYFEILETIENPQKIFEGNNEAKIAIKPVKDLISKFIVVIYGEISIADGFVLTAYLSNKEQEFEKKKILWKQQN